MQTEEMATAYEEFIRSKSVTVAPNGIDVPDSAIHANLYDFQRAIVRWAAKRGRAAIWADCGMGKTLMQLEWARLMGGPSLIFAPLAVARQTVEEAKKIGLDVPYVRDASEYRGPISITNYERLEAFKDMPLRNVVLDESSILKSFDGRTRKNLIQYFQGVPYRLACTATPAPNDYLELGNHAQFLGIMSWQEMAAMFFVHDQQAGDGNRGDMTGQWRLKGHAQEEFWKWLVSWGIFIKRPSDLGFDDRRFVLPKLQIEEAIVKTDAKPDGMLFAAGLHGIQERIMVRQATIDDRVQRAAEVIGSDVGQWIAWVGLNDEGRALAAILGGDCRLVEGSDDPEAKAQDLLDFARGKYRVLITKSKIAGFGMNFQNCSRMVFVGLSDSYEAYYQCIRRSWRYGQKKPVRVVIVTSETEEGIVSNVKRKERDAETMSTEMVKHMAELEQAEVNGAAREEVMYERATARGEGWTLHLGDCVDVVRELPSASVDFSVYSPPFASLYTYTNSPRDMGNCKGEDAFFTHFGFLVTELLRVTKAGRLTACHVAQLAAMASRDGYIGLKDFRGRVIQAFVAAGWIHHGEIVIDKNPQAQAIRTKTKGLLFTQLHKDSSWMRPALADFLLVFRAPGDNAVPVKPEISNEDWIKWAHPVWYDIRETETLTAAEGRDEKDEKHICPLQLDVIDRAVMLYTNPGETVLSPFAGIGSEGYQSILRRRKFIGAELKRSYWKAACSNLKAAHAKAHEGELFQETA